MPRLFTALDLHPATAHELTALQPAPAPGLRLVPPDQMHLTLHFLGDADTDRITAALATIAAAPFQLDLRGVGHFHSAGGAVTLWAGVELGAELLRLHAAVGAALAGVGFEPEGRPYTPHVSLARCEAEAVTPSFVDGFLKQYAGLRITGAPVTRFGLFSSEQGREAPVYRCERVFPLLMPWNTCAPSDLPPASACRLSTPSCSSSARLLPSPSRP
jgi:2'-5' RNA ligase